MWVVLSDPSKKGSRWDEKEFFATGRQEVGNVLARIRDSGLSPSGDRALDFGCGLGRLSQALAEHFAAVDGVDISNSMIEQARMFDRTGGRVKYHLNVNPDLREFPPEAYDFIISVISLQHTPPKFQLGYIADFVRLLKPGGVAYFQTIHALGWRHFVPHSAADAYRRWKHRGKAFIPMYGVPVAAVRRAVTKRSGKIIEFNSSVLSDGLGRYMVDTYLVWKNG